MKNWRRVIAFVLFVCLTVSLMPPVQFAKAAEAEYRYELDTDGIDPGETYLIVNTSAKGSANVLRDNGRSTLQKQAVTIQTDDEGTPYIETGFSNETQCQFQFTGATSGKAVVGSNALNLTSYATNFESTANASTLNFTHTGGGAYTITSSSGWRTYYLRYSGSSWGKNTSSAKVYLFKLREYHTGFDVVYNGNGNTHGTVPADDISVAVGAQYSVKAPTDLRIEVGEDTYLFQCWNTAPDGSGTEYAPGDTFEVTGHSVLYAQWYKQVKYGVTMITYLNGAPTDVSEISGEDKQFAVLRQEDGENAAFIPLTWTAEGTYTARVTENGTYVVYSRIGEGEYSPVHGHKVIIYNQDGSTECSHYSVSYNAAGGAWAEGEAPAEGIYHANEAVVAHDKIPAMAGNTFLGWQDENYNIYAPGQTITGTINGEIKLTAVWEENIDVTVNITLHHSAENGGNNENVDKNEVLLRLLKFENDANLPLEDIVLNEEKNYDPNTDTTTYTYVFKDLPKGHYHATASKSHYEVTTEHSGEHDTDQTINIDLQYSPSNFDLHFDVVIEDFQNQPKELIPQAVNVKVSYWGYKDGKLAWHIITQQEGVGVPVTVAIDENGKGTGFFPVWKYWTDADGTIPFVYRIEVTSFVMPDGQVVSANETEASVKFVGSIYTVDITVMPDDSGDIGKLPTYPKGSNTDLYGAFFDDSDDAQNGRPTATVTITPFTVTFDAGEGTVNGQDSITLQGQHRYPDLAGYTAQSSNPEEQFMGWEDETGKLVTNLAGQLLTGNVTYYARYKGNLTISGQVSADSTYELGGEIAQVDSADRIKEVLVVLQKKMGNSFNDMDSQLVTLIYKDGVGTGNYSFADLPNDGTEYRVYVSARNYTDTYDNNGDGDYATDQAVAQIGQTDTEAEVDVHLAITPEFYEQTIQVDTSLIYQDMRPSGALAQILYRDLGGARHYKVVSQHEGSPYGTTVKMEGSFGSATEDLWERHVDGTLYEYQMQVRKLYGTAYGAEGMTYDENSPFTITYGASSNVSQNSPLIATLVPKEYGIVMDLNLGADTHTPVIGLEDYMVDDGTGDERYAYVHTWSFGDQFVAYPYREGYVFEGWESSDEVDVHIEDGTIYVAKTLDHNVTLTAKWRKLSYTDYTVRYLEQNTDKVLNSHQAVSGAVFGSQVHAADEVLAIEGYKYVGASVNGNYMDKTENPTLTVTNNPADNVLVIYYLPDGSDGYTDQVEGNLELNKTAVLENDGTYTITLDTYTKNNPITTLVQQNTPMDIVLVLDQSSSIAQSNYIDARKNAVDTFIAQIASHGRENEVDHRIALVGYSGNSYSSAMSDTTTYPLADGDTGATISGGWVNTGVFDSNGVFHRYNITGFNYAPYTGSVETDGVYYTYDEESKQYLLLTYHKEYRHLITEDEAIIAEAQGTAIYGYADGGFVKLTKNSSGLWLYGNKQLYSSNKFFTYHEQVWTHRRGLERRQIHGYVVDGKYVAEDGHSGIYTREDTNGSAYDLSVYKDALMPASVGANGSGGVNPGLTKATESLGANGHTYVQYGVEMANHIFEANPTEGTDRIRVMVMFTDGMPGSGTFSPIEANAAIEKAHTTKNEHGAFVYTVALYAKNENISSEQAYFMQAMSSNYPDALEMNDAANLVYTASADTEALNTTNTFVKDGENYYLLYTSFKTSGGYKTLWKYDGPNGTVTIAEAEGINATPVYPTNGKVGDYEIFKSSIDGFKDTTYSGYYSTADNAEQLKQYFEDLVDELTTKVSKEVILHQDTILRDIMGQGLVMTDETVISVYQVPGEYAEGGITWKNENKNLLATMKIGANPKDQKQSTDYTTTITYTAADGTKVVKKDVPYISVYNLQADNATNPDEANYHPHAVDITGYDFENWHISEEHPEGSKMVVEITNIEATDDVQWGRSTTTNNDQSGLWLPADVNGVREFLLAFDQPTTVFVERTYVLDYGKQFTLSDWYFDDDVGKEATPKHLDCNIADGMNKFNAQDPNYQNVIGGEYGNTKYGNVTLENGVVTYTPTTMHYSGYDEFYVFGTTWRKTVLAQDANKNGNLWNKVTVIPANNIYFEDSFVTTQDTTQNGIEGFKFTGNWSVVNGEGAGENVEVPEHLESAPYGEVHGWTDALDKHRDYTDGSAHVTGMNKEIGASVEFDFTGTGVDVYSSTNAKSGMVVAVLTKHETKADGTTANRVVKSLALDNVAVSGDYYHIPTVSFLNLDYGSYTLKIIATAAADAATGVKRYEYCVDGVRIYNPLGRTTNEISKDVKDAYVLENNPVFTEIRDILLDYGDFNVDMPDGTDGKLGAVFIDTVKDGQGTGKDQTGNGIATYEIGTFQAYGPKNEVYLASGQAIVLKVEEGNHYYVGLSSLKGDEVTVNVSGIDRADPQKITLSHATDMYYRVTPDEGYIVIENASNNNSVLGLTKLRTTNDKKPAPNGGVKDLTAVEAVEAMEVFAQRMLAANKPPIPQQPEIPELPKTPAQLAAEENGRLAQVLFSAVRAWMKGDEQT